MKSFRKTYGPVMTVLALAGFILSLILTLHGLSMTELVGCSSGSSCDTVTGSRWSMILGFLPVSSLSMGLYLAILLCVIYLYSYEDDFVKKALAALSAALLAGSVWFICLQTFVIEAFCPYCMSAHVCGILLPICSFIWLAGSSSSDGKLLLKTSGYGFMLAAAFVVLQILTTPSYRVVTGQTRDPLPIPQASDAPCIGPVDAPYAVALLYDYQCPHCKVIHDMLEDVSDRLDGQVCFVLCPSPLSPSCNPYIPYGKDMFPGSCTMASLALSLWKHDPHAFSSYDRWLFESPRTEEECLEEAFRLCDEVQQNDPWAQQYLSGTLELFARTSMEGKGGIPRLVYGDSWAVPEVDDPEKLAEIVRTMVSPQ